MQEVKLNINGKEITAEKGQTIPEVALKNSIDIPYLCYYPLVSKTGACRSCIVRVNNTMLKYFRHEFEQHCKPAHKCPECDKTLKRFYQYLLNNFVLGGINE